MNDEATADAIASLHSRFRAAECRVTALSEDSFEIIGQRFPVRTHVLANAYFLQFSTFVHATPQGWFPGRRSKLDAYLNVINLRAKLVKFTVDAAKPDPRRGGWPIFASVRLVTGAIGINYDDDAIKNLTMLWFQDLAELIASPGGFELDAMMVKEDR